MTCHKVGGAHLHHAGVLTGALIHTLRASFFKVAMVGHIDGVRHVAGNVEQGIASRIQGRLGLLQADGVRMHGVVEDLGNGTLLNNSTCIHNDDVVRHLCDNAEVVSDKHDRAVDLIFQLLKQIENLPDCFSPGQSQLFFHRRISLMLSEQIYGSMT
mgnify:CR=1 FL=1